MFQPRPKQQEVLAYRGGKMGVSAVPGSGKTQTLSYLAAQLVAEGGLEDDQEVLVVTLVNSAVDNFASRVRGFVRERVLLPGIGYRVRTLHGLAHDIVRERPALVGLADDFQIVDEREATQILESAAEAWLREHSFECDQYLSPDLEDARRDWVRRNDEQWPRLVADIGYSLVIQAKDRGCSPADLRASLDRAAEPLPLAEMGLAIYSDYQRALAYRGAVDFNDLIRLALAALKLDPEFLARLQHRWPFILEDEAQDSSSLQEQILRQLAGPTGNWVRVGDPNQAIFETFTTASPQFLRDFLREKGVAARDLPNSGRSTHSVIRLANRLVAWAQDEHPVPAVAARALARPPEIEPTPPGDPQPNPPDDPAGIRLVMRKLTPAEEVTAVADSLQRWLPDHPDRTVAVLVPRNDRGFALADELKRRGIEYVELLRSTGATREAAGALANVVNYLADPASPKKLATAFKVWRRADRADADRWAQVERVARGLGQCGRVEAFVWPLLEAGKDGLPGVELAEEDRAQVFQLHEFRELVRRWQGTASLPIDQAVLTIAQDLFDRPADLALAHRLASLLHAAARAHPDWRLSELTQELAVIARNERKFLGFGDDDAGFDPDRYRGKPVIVTVHKAKGLEWERVYLMSVNNYDYPSAAGHDTFIAEKWFVRDGLNLQAEALAQLEACLGLDGKGPYVEGLATRDARIDYAAERLRLLYVGITRARRELIVTWNTGKGKQPAQPAAALLALSTWWEEQNRGRAGAGGVPA